jgi:protein-L-isoaspartate(D-aspartate) O-methyltransferase
MLRRGKNVIRRRHLLTVAAALAAWRAAPALANVPKPYNWDFDPPTTTVDVFVSWMQENRGEDADFLRERSARFQVMVANRDLVDDRNKRGFLLTPREDFVLKADRDRAYDDAFLRYRFRRNYFGPTSGGPND